MSGVVRRSGSKLLRIIERALDPAAEVGRALVYSKAVAGASQLFARASDGSVYQLTPTEMSIISFGNGDITQNANTRYLAPYYAQAGATADPVDLVVPRAGVIRNLYVLHNTPVGDGDPVVYTVMLNGVATTLTATLASNAAGPASDLVNSVAVAVGDRLGVRVTKGADITDGNLHVVATMILSV